MTSNTFEQSLGEVQALRFLPYIGPEFGHGLRIFMLGEAPYSDGEPNPATFLENLVRGALEASAARKTRERWVRYVRNISAMLTGNYGGSDEVWNTLAYGVFMQNFYRRGRDNRKHVTDEDAARAHKAFFGQLDVLRPDVVVIWGQTLLSERWLFPDDDALILDPALGVFVLTEYPRVCIWSTHHPSRDFSHATEHEHWLAVRRIVDGFRKG